LLVETAAPSSVVCSASQPHDGPCPVCPHLAERFEPFRKAAYWKAMHEKALLRQAELEQRVAELEAHVRLREQQLFGKKSEPASPRRPPRPNRQAADPAANSWATWPYT